MEQSPVADILNPFLSKPQTTTGAQVVKAAAQEMDQLLAATVPPPSQTVGTKVDLKA